MRVACIWIKSAVELDRFAEACLRFSPQLALGPSAVFLEIGACRCLYSEESLLRRLKILIKRFDLNAVTSIANDIPTALSLAMFQKSNRHELPIHAIQVYTNPFFLDESMKKVSATLIKLGITTLGKLLDLPKDSLALRFSKDILFAIDCIETAVSLPWPRFSPVDRVFESKEVDPDYNIKSLQPVLFVLRGLVDRILLRLRGRSELACALEIEFELEKYTYVKKSQRIVTIELALPQSSTVSLMAILHDRLNHVFDLNPLEAPVRRVCVTVLRTVISLGRQRDFFSRREEELENFRSVVGRLSERLGPDKAFMASLVESYFPDRSWKKTLEEPREVASLLSVRPSRVLQRPLSLQRLDRYFICKHRRWTIREMIGPERLTGEWWLKEEERSYFRVITEEGEDLWIYSCPRTYQFYLHGIYD